MEPLLERGRELAAVEELLRQGGGFLAIEAGAGLGKTALMQAACRRAQELGYQVLRARGAELEEDFAFGVVRQLFERRLASAVSEEREALLDGAGATARSLLFERKAGATATDSLFSVLHGLYWLAANLSAARPLLLAIDDAHWADELSLRWLVYLAPRLDGLRLALLVALRPQEPGSAKAALLALRSEATMLLHPALLSRAAVTTLVGAAMAGGSHDQISDAVWAASGGNPLYVSELLRGFKLNAQEVAELDLTELFAGGLEGIGRRVVARVRSLDPSALRLAQALAVLGDGCVLRHAAAIAGLGMTDAIRLAAGLVRLEVLADAPPGFVHPIIRDALEASLGGEERDAAHRAAARLLHADRAAAGQIAAHLMGLQHAGDNWVLTRLQEAAQEAIESGAPKTAADLLNRALAEPPSAIGRIGLLRQTARAEASAGREAAFMHLAEARRLATDPRERAEIALEVAEAYAALFRWADAVEAIAQALAELGEADKQLTARLESELVICGLHDARCAARVKPVLKRLYSPLAGESPLEEAVAVAQGMAMALAGQPAAEVAVPLEVALARARSPTANWDTRAALLWTLVTAERFGVVETALKPMLAEVHRSGSARGLVATYSTLGLLKLPPGGGLGSAGGLARSAGGRFPPRPPVCRDCAGRRGDRSRRA
ncbi:MAG TPA: AAA family ATPase [Roseiarcus sp.]|nr:AAA family ATPase [Roseiarcus sp.]